MFLRRYTALLALLVMFTLPALVAAQDATEEPVMEEVAATEEAMMEEVVATEEAMMDDMATEEAAATEEATEEPTATATSAPATTSTTVTCPPDDAESIEYRIQPGDTLSSISRAYNIPAVCLARFNDIVNPSLIFWGSTINVPSEDAPDPGTGGPEQPEENELTTYTVAQGDNLYRISLRFDSTISELQNLNPTVTNPNVIFVGQELVVPDSDTESEE